MKYIVCGTMYFSKEVEARDSDEAWEVVNQLSDESLINGIDEIYIDNATDEDGNTVYYN